jgi:recombination protein RecT
METKQETKALKPIEEKNITENVLTRFLEIKANGMIDIPDDYSAENALKSAWFILQNVNDKDKKPALQVCEKHSIANSLYEMVVNGLNPMKKQCYFIVYGNKLTCMTSYQGSIAMAKRYSGVKSVIAREIYKNDKFVTEILPDGREIFKSHDQPFENTDGEIIGGYAIVIDCDGREHLTKMTIGKIKKSWAMGVVQGKGKPHTEFTDEMVKRTLINRACKPWINSSNDENIIDDDKPEAKMDGNQEQKHQPLTLSIEPEPPEAKEKPGKTSKKVEPEAKQETTEESPY